MKKEKNYKIGIISFNINSDTSNYGAALHSYAFQKYLDKYNISNVIINYYPKFVQLKRLIYNLRDLLRERNFIGFYFYFKFIIKLCKKKKKLIAFFRKNTRITVNRYNIKTLSKLKNIGLFVCETDTTWHKQGGFLYDRGFFCDLSNMKSKPNVAYSVDTGTKPIEENDKEILRKYAKNFKYISIRMPFKINTFKDILQRDDIKLTIDPTLLLNEEDYSPIIKNPNKKNFVCVYNCKENDPLLIAEAEKYAHQHNKELVVINSYDKFITDYTTLDLSLYGIEEFLGLIKNCDYLFKNSYHGICFSIIFKKQFTCFPRKGNNEKILTLLELFNLKNRMFSSSNEILSDINYDETYLLMKKLKAQSEEFIRNSIFNEADKMKDCE